MIFRTKNEVNTIVRALRKELVQLEVDPPKRVLENSFASALIGVNSYAALIKQLPIVPDIHGAMGRLMDILVGLRYERASAVSVSYLTAMLLRCEGFPKIAGVNAGQYLHIRFFSKKPPIPEIVAVPAEQWGSKAKLPHGVWKIKPVVNEWEFGRLMDELMPRIEEISLSYKWIDKVNSFDYSLFIDRQFLFVDRLIEDFNASGNLIKVDCIKSVVGKCDVWPDEHSHITKFRVTKNRYFDHQTSVLELSKFVYELSTKSGVLFNHQCAISYLIRLCGICRKNYEWIYEV